MSSPGSFGSSNDLEIIHAHAICDKISDGEHPRSISIANFSSSRLISSILSRTIFMCFALASSVGMALLYLDIGSRAPLLMTSAPKSLLWRSFFLSAIDSSRLLTLPMENVSLIVSTTLSVGLRTVTSQCLSTSFFKSTRILRRVS